MSRLAPTFARLREQGRRALIPFVTAGDPDPEVTVPLMHALVAAGADVLELGVPFSDPMADGPVIQRAHERALRHRVSLRGVLQMVARFRTGDADTPVVLMGYLNPVEAMGYAQFAEQAAAAGVDGVLVVDLPPEEAGGLLEALAARDIDPIFLVAPTTDAARMARIAQVARGFLYYVSLKGVTGAASLQTAELGGRLAAIRAHTTLPVGVGFGIRDAASAAEVAALADAVIVGSALVREVEAHAGEPRQVPGAVAALLGEMRAAMDERTRADRRATP